MTKTKSTKRALLSSVLALMVCIAMLIGTTYAWFTDSVTSGGNKIVSGNLDIDLYQWNSATDSVEITNESAPIFGSAGLAQDSTNTLWEPGKTQVVYLSLKNNGSLDLKYKVGVDVENPVGGKNLYEVMQYAITNDAKFGSVDKWTNGVDVAEGLNTTQANDVTLGAGDEHFFALSIHMEESAGNEYMDGQVNFDIRVLAIQLASEFDSFGPDYDKDAEYAVTVSTIDDLANALAVGENIVLTDDIDFTAENKLGNSYGFLTQSSSIDGGDKTITDTSASRYAGIYAGNIDYITNLTLKTNSGYGIFAVAVDREMNFSNVTVEKNSPGSVIYADNSTNNLILDNVVATGTGTATGGFAHAVVFATGNSGSNITINSGTYTATDANGYAVASFYSSVVTINGGTFTGNLITNGNGKIVIKGGTFNVDPSAYVADGYVATESNGTWTVSGYEVSSETELADAIADGKVVTLTQNINLGKIDLTGAITKDVVIDANGHKITTTESYGIEATPGKNITISNADVEMTKEGDYITYAAGFKIANGDYAGATITLKNCNITMANGDWAYAVNMPAGVKNLNLVIDNCTLEGAIAVQCWGDNNTITITNSELICNYTTSALYSSCCVALQSDGSNVSENNTLVIDKCKFKYSGVDNFNSEITDVDDLGTGNNVTVTNCTYDAKVVAN